MMDGWLTRSIRAAGALAMAATMTLLLTFSASAVDDCSVNVAPREGPPETEFVFTGAGAELATLTFTQAGEDPREAALEDGKTELRLLATEDDAGRWNVAATFRDSDCTAETTIMVTLPPTSAVEELAAANTSLAIAAMALIFVFMSALAVLDPRRRVARS